MKKNYGYAYLVLLLCVNIFIILFENNLLDKAKFSWVNDELNESEEFRQTKINSNTLEYMLQNSLKGSELSKFVTKVWFHEKITGKEFSQNYIKEFENAYWFHPLLKDFKTEYEVLEQSNQALWGDLKYFPVAFSTGNEKMTVTYENSWKFERTYGGKRYHEGCDIMADINQRGVYPVVSICDGVVEKMGWLPKGGYRIGIRGDSGAYFYYAHLESYADIQIGEKVYAGELIGYMGDSGYGEEGTVGKFAVHLHIGIYIPTKNHQEISVNPYPMLKYLENKKIGMDYDK